MNKLIINPVRQTGSISPLVFGSFIENMFQCIYGGVYDPNSPMADDEGFRTDVLKTAGLMGISNVRFPGGCYAAYYHWKDGIDPKQTRPRTRYRDNDNEWPPNNDFGTDEFISWCKKLGAEPYLCVNMGSGTPEEARDWVEYCNGQQGSRWADVRIKNGHPEPYQVKYWAIGNEISASWELGYADSPEEYIKRAREYCRAMRSADPTIKFILSGAHFPIDFPHDDWNRKVLDKLYDYADFISVHHYIGHDYKDDVTKIYKELGEEATHYRLSEYMRLLEDAFSIMREDIRLINHKHSCFKPIGIALDEYNPWYRGPGDNEIFNLSDSLLVASYFNLFFRNSDVVQLCNMAQLVNTIPSMVCKPGETDFFRQGPSYIQEIFSQCKGMISLDFWLDCKMKSGIYYSEFPILDISVCRDPYENRIIVNIVNRDCQSMQNLHILCPQDRLTPLYGKQFTGKTISTHNSFQCPNCYQLTEVKWDGNIVALPPLSFTTLAVKIDK